MYINDTQYYVCLPEILYHDKMKKENNRLQRINTNGFLRVIKKMLMELHLVNKKVVPLQTSKKIDDER
jgi:hypothetical protein